MESILSVTFIVGVLSAMLRIATPLILGTIGELFNERAGILNLGIEGIVTFGAMSAFIITLFTGNAYLGILVAMVCGILLSLLMGFLTVTLRLDQDVCGLGLLFLASGLSYFIYRLAVGIQPVPPTIQNFSALQIPLLSNIPYLGEILFKQYSLFYIAILLIPLSQFILYKTHFGLNIRSCGENPAAADTMGVNVTRTRYQSLAIGGALFGLAGAYFTVFQMNIFIFGMVAGRGIVCIALVVFGNWKPVKCFLGALLFAFIDAFQLRLQHIGLQVPYQFFLLLPYLFTVIVLVLAARGAVYPQALLKPYSRED